MSRYRYRAELRSTSHGYTVSETTVDVHSNDEATARKIAQAALPEVSHGHIWMLVLQHIDATASVGSAT